MELIRGIIELLKSSLPILQEYFWPVVLYVAACGWAIILLPPSIFRLLHIDNLRSSNLEAIGSVAFVSTFTFCFGLLWKGLGLLKTKRETGQELQQRSRLLQSLTSVERSIMRNYIGLQTQTATFSLYDGVVAGLVQKGVLYKPNSLANKAGEQDYNISLWAYDYLSSHREILDLGADHEGQDNR